MQELTFTSSFVCCWLISKLFGTDEKIHVDKQEGTHKHLCFNYLTWPPQEHLITSEISKP